eukprot:328412-Rhodomonas_salina.1
MQSLFESEWKAYKQTVSVGGGEEARNNSKGGKNTAMYNKVVRLEEEAGQVRPPFFSFSFFFFLSLLLPVFASCSRAFPGQACAVSFCLCLSRSRSLSLSLSLSPSLSFSVSLSAYRPRVCHFFACSSCELRALLCLGLSYAPRRTS